MILFTRRLGPDPQAHGATAAACFACCGCPDIWELGDGDFAVIGTDITHAAGDLPASANVGPGERMVRIPRQTLVLAKRDIPSEA